MNLSWKCFLSPAKAARIIRELRKEAENNLSLLENKCRQLDDAMKRVESLTEKSLHQQTELDSANISVRSLTDTLLATRLQLDEANSELRKADELRQSLADITDRYKEAKRHIKSLQEKLEMERDADKILFSTHHDNELMDIYPVTEPQFPLDDTEEKEDTDESAVELPPLPPPPVADTGRHIPDDDDWLMRQPL